MKIKKELKFGGLLMLALAFLLVTSFILSTNVMAYYISGDGEIHQPRAEAVNGEEVKEVEVVLSGHELPQEEIEIAAGEEVEILIENTGSNTFLFTLSAANPDEE